MFVKKITEKQLDEIYIQFLTSLKWQMAVC